MIDLLLSHQKKAACVPQLRILWRQFDRFGEVDQRGLSLAGIRQQARSLEVRLSAFRIELDRLGQTLQSRLPLPLLQRGRRLSSSDFTSLEAVATDGMSVDGAFDESPQPTSDRLQSPKERQCSRTETARAETKMACA